MDEDAVKTTEPADSDSSMYTDENIDKKEGGIGAMDEDVSGCDRGMIHPLSFNTLTFFARH